MSNSLKLALIPLTVSLLLTGCNDDKNTSVQAQTEASKTAVTTEISANSIVVSAYDIAKRSADWQLSHLNNLDYIPDSHKAKSEDPKFWIQAAFYIGLSKWAETTDNKEYLAFMENVAKEQNYELHLSRPYHADDHTIAQTYLWLTEQTGNQDAYKPTQELFDMILANKPKVGLEMIDIDKNVDNKHTSKSHLEGNCQLRWCWADALYMAPRAWLKMTKVTGDPKYFEYADQEFWAAADYLFSDQYGLFFRDSRYFEMKSINDKPVFWGRGNGWVFAALPLIIDDLPKDHPSRDRYIALYKKNAAGLMKLQRDNGYWPASLMDPELVKTPEMSGTGFITYGLAWGVNNGILQGEEARNVVTKGWSAIEKAVAPSGRVNWVQHVGKGPDPVKETDSQLYGVGAVLLAASEMIKWSDK